MGGGNLLVITTTNVVAKNLSVELLVLVRLPDHFVKAVTQPTRGATA